MNHSQASSAARVAPSTGPDPRRLIVALDLPTVAQARTLADRLDDLPVVFKIGHQLAYTGGLALAEDLIARGHQIFLDLKLHDIPRTVEEAVRSLAGFGATFLTVHAYPQTVAAALEGKGPSDLMILGVTVLTSMDDADAAAAGLAGSVEEIATRRAAASVKAGIDGLVCAATEVAVLRDAVGPGTLLVVPGIRPRGTEAGDQKRVMNPADARAAGADLIVVGRPITGAADPRAAADAILAELDSAHSARGPEGQ